MMHYKRCAIGVLVLALLLAGIISSCRPPTAEPTPTPTPTVLPPPPTPTEEEFAQVVAKCQGPSAQGLEKLNASSEFAGLLYVENQVVLTGAPNMIELVAKIVGLGDLKDRFDLDGQTAVYLYNTAKTVQQVTCEANMVGPSYNVWADPNYHLSPAQWIGGGSPWTQNGNWVGNQPGGGQGSATGREFREQWAFGPRGIRLLNGNGMRWGQEMGKGTRIAIFDTSPFSETKWIDNKCDHCSIQSLTDGASVFAGVSMTLTVWHQIDLIPAPTCPGTSRNDPARRSLESQDISNHGLFIAGLAHAVAPASEIYLVRVLEDDGCGTLYQIVKGIHVFAQEILGAAGTLHGTILNLSLGVHKTDRDTDFGLPGNIASLEAVLDWASDQGAIIVAAAGNDSYETPAKDPRVMELPAGYPFVAGVAASSSLRARGCFSNANEAADPLDVAAPGGDGLYLDTKQPCAVPDCTKNSVFCLISMIYKPEPGYAYWVGTSFAAPLYSGQRALLFEREAAAGIVTPEIEDYTCSSSDETLPNGIADWARASGVQCP